MLPNKALAATSFMSGPDDDLATADVYQVESDAVVNDTPTSILDDFVQTDNKAVHDELQGGIAMAANLPIKDNPLLAGAAKVKDAATSAVKESSLLDKAKALGSSALNAVGGVGGLTKIAGSLGPSLLQRAGSGSLGVPGLPSNALSSLTSVLNNRNLTPGLASAFSSAIPNVQGSFLSSGGLTSRIGVGQIADSYQISNLINNVVGGTSPFNVVDKDASTRLIAGLATAGFNSGLPNAFSSVAPLAGGDKSILAMAASQTLSAVSRTGNIGSIKDISKAVGPSLIGPVSTGVMRAVASTYSLKGTTASNSNDQIKQDFHDTVETFDDINDDWRTTTRAYANPDDPSDPIHEKVLDFSTVNSGSPDFRNMMHQGAVCLPNTPENSDLKYMAMASSFPVTSPEAELKKNFPMTYLDLPTNTQPVVDQVTPVETPADANPVLVDAQEEARKKEEKHQAYLKWAREKNILINGVPFNEINNGNGYSEAI